MRIVVFNDPHYSRHEPACRSPDYGKEILAKFHAVEKIAASVNAVGIGCTGDWFHRKGKVTFTESIDILSVLVGWRKRDYKVFGIVGNHDIAGHSLTNMDRRAVGVFHYSDALQLLDYKPLTIRGGAKGFHITGTSYFHGCDKDDESRLKMYGSPIPRLMGAGTETVMRVHLAHGTLINKGTFYDEFTVAPDLIDLLWDAESLPDVIICGHLHYSEGITEYPHPAGGGRKVLICRVGSLGRVSSDDLHRTPSVCVLATNGSKVVGREVSLPAIQFGQSQRGPKQETTDELESRIKAFVNDLREEADKMALGDQEEIIRVVGERLGKSQDAIDLALRYIEGI